MKLTSKQWVCLVNNLVVMFFIINLAGWKLGCALILTQWFISPKELGESDDPEKPLANPPTPCGKEKE